MQNRYIAAFKESHNLIGVAAVTAISAALLNPLPLLVGLVLEAAYLLFIPDSKYFQARLARLKVQDNLERRDEAKQRMLPLLRPELRARYQRLEEMRTEIQRQSASDPAWMSDVIHKLDFLLEKFLSFAGKEEQFRSYLAEVRAELSPAQGPAGRRPTSPLLPDSGIRPDDPLIRRARGPMANGEFSGTGPSRGPVSGREMGPIRPGDAPTPPSAPSSEAWLRESVALVQASYDREVKELESCRAEETDTNTCAILDKRLEVLHRRREFIGKIGKIVANLDHQLALLEDTFGLINDELLARPPEQVVADIDDVVTQTNTMTQVLEEIAPYEQMLHSSSLRAAGLAS